MQAPWPTEPGDQEEFPGLQMQKQGTSYVKSSFLEDTGAVSMLEEEHEDVTHLNKWR